MGRPRIDPSLDAQIRVEEQDRDLRLRTTTQGLVYVMISRGQQWKSATRVIAARLLGRKLKLTERVICRNGDLTDVRRENLAVVSSGEWRRMNEANKSGKVKTSRFKGVSWAKKPRKWRASIQLPSENGQRGKGKFLGHYNTEEEAALAYNEAVKELSLPHAFLNDLDA